MRKIIITEEQYKLLNENDGVSNVIDFFFTEGYTELAVELIKSQNLDIDELVKALLQQRFGIGSIKGFGELIKNKLNNGLRVNWINITPEYLPSKLALRLEDRKNFNWIELTFALSGFGYSTTYDSFLIPYSEFTERLPEAYKMLLKNAKEFLFYFINREEQSLD
jgi:hypothetical protein